MVQSLIYKLIFVFPRSRVRIRLGEASATQLGIELTGFLLGEASEIWMKINTYYLLFVICLMVHGVRTSSSLATPFETVPSGAKGRAREQFQRRASA